MRKRKIRSNKKQQCTIIRIRLPNSMGCVHYGKRPSRLKHLIPFGFIGMKSSKISKAKGKHRGASLSKTSLFEMGARIINGLKAKRRAYSAKRLVRIIQLHSFITAFGILLSAFLLKNSYTNKKACPVNTGS